MAKTIELICKECGKVFEKPRKEYDRQIREGRDKDHFFCSQACATRWQNVDCEKYARTLIKFCPFCDTLFTTQEGKHEREYCSRSCASQDNITEYRRKRARESGENHQDNLISIDELLKVREARKYGEMKRWLNSQGINYEFEYPLGGYVFDLYLRDKDILIEFDGEYHREAKQRKVDKQKDKVAMDNGFSIKRINVDSGAKIPVEPIQSIVMGAN